jgi:hypothetical protein
MAVEVVEAIMRPVREHMQARALAAQFELYGVLVEHFRQLIPAIYK